MAKFLVYTFIIACICAALALISLSIDESEVRYSTDIEDYVPMPEGGAENFEKLLKLSRIELKLIDIERPDSVKWIELEADKEAYKRFILSQKDTILSNYAKLKPVLPLIRELSKAGEIGDTYRNLESEYVKFRTIRDCLQTISFYTELTYYDETLEADSNDLHAFIQLQQNWVEHTRIFVNVMIAIVSLEEGYEVVERLLPYFSEKETERWLEQLAPPFDAVSVVANAYYGEYCGLLSTVESLENQGGSRLPFLFHKNRTLNIYGEHANRIVQFSQSRDWEGMSKYWEDFEAKLEPTYFRRNYIGWLVLAMAIPASQKVFENADELNEQQDELLSLLNNQGLRQ